jgi:hypothetical protein
VSQFEIHSHCAEDGRTGERGTAKRPRDLNQLARLAVDIASGEVPGPVSESKRHPSQRDEPGKSRAVNRERRF